MKLFTLLLVTSFSLLALDVNHAELKELQTLKGVGKKTLEKNRELLEAKKCES